MDDRIEGLLAELTLEEKVRLLAGTDLWHAAGVERLDVPPAKVTDGPHGARGADFSGSVAAACFPCGTALASSWNVDLLEEVGRALGDETRTKSAHVLLGPTVNIHRSPLAGRNFECYSEDPLLSARMAVAWVVGLQSRGVGACVKHFVCNDSEFERHTISSEVDERTLREIYLAPFEAVVRQADPWSLMTAYNRINRTYACDHPLLADVLRGEWGFRGFVVSDWFGLQSTEASVRAGNDLEMPGPGRWRGEKLVAAVREGRLDEKELDAPVRRMLELRARAGILQGPVEDLEEAVDRPEHRDVARRAAREGIVLLKNEGDALPLDGVRRLAVIGPNAAIPVILGGGSSRVAPHYTVSPLDGIRARCGEAVQVVHETGCRNHRTIPVLRGAFELRFHDGFGLEGEPVFVQEAEHVDFTWLGRFREEVDPESCSVLCAGEIVAEETGPHVFSLINAGKARLLVDGRVVVDNWDDQVKGDSFYGAGSAERTGEIELEAGRRVRVEIEYSKEGAPVLGGLRAGLERPLPEDSIGRAARAAADCDAAVVVVGLNADWETEGRDREDMQLPGRQVELVEAVAAANPRTVVVLNAGSPLATDWIDRVPAALCLWYAGQEAGNALAEVLFGDVDASGRLPQTWPVRLEDNPAHGNYPGDHGVVRYGEGIFVGYRHYEKRGVVPRFPFGHGLSYTRFAYGPLSATRRGDEVEVELEISKGGARPGGVVVQIYIRPRVCGAERPEKELAAFCKLALGPGETATARMVLGPRAFAFWDAEAHDWCVEAGAFELVAGSSSADVRSRVEIDYSIP